MNRSHLQIVDENYRAPRSRRVFVPPANGKIELRCLVGGALEPKALHHEHERIVQAEFSYDMHTERYVAKLMQNGELLEIRSSKDSSKRLMTLWFESVDGQKPRVPWAKIAAGIPWTVDVLMRETFFQVHRAQNLN